MATLRESYNDTGDLNLHAQLSNTSYRAGQTFSHSDTFSITNVKIYAYSVGSPGDAVLEVFAVDGSDFPTGSALASKQLTSASFGSGVGNSSWVDFIFDTPAELTGTTTYAIVLKGLSPITQNTDTYEWWYDSAGATYANGRLIFSTDSGSSWSEQVDRDRGFEVWGDDAGLSITPSATTMRVAVGSSHVAFIPPLDRTTIKRLVAASKNRIYYEDI